MEIDRVTIRLEADDECDRHVGVIVAHSPFYVGNDANKLLYLISFDGDVRGCHWSEFDMIEVAELDESYD